MYFNCLRHMKNESEYCSGKEAGELLRVQPQTLRIWNKQGKISSIRTPSNQRLYLRKEVEAILNRNSPSDPRRKICYTRVSSKKQEDDLDRQISFYKSEYPEYEVLSDIGSGINWKRKGLQTILEQCMLGRVQEIVVSHKDRLCRFGFELFEFIFEKNNVKLTLLDDRKGESPEQELAEDIISIIHVYSCREYGKRRYKNKKAEDLPISSAEENIKGLDEDNKISVE